MTRAELLAALKSAKGPITDLDKFYRYAPWYDTAEIGDPIWNDWGKALQGSLDAAISLVERVRPGHVVVIITGPLEHSAYIRHPEGNQPRYSVAATPALALLIALLSSDADQSGYAKEAK